MDRKTCGEWKHNNKAGSRNIGYYNEEGTAVGKEYRERNIIHKQMKNRRPKTYLTEEQKKIIDEVWNEI